MRRMKQGIFGLGLVLAATTMAADRPNILWLTSEDNGPHLGCFGDAVANTPTLDALAKRGARYPNAWSTAPVCAPARSTLITGLYPPSLGSQHMRSKAPRPPMVHFYAWHLREAGYYTTNHTKTDYNMAMEEGAWDASDRKAHWKNRKAGQPFFAVFNDTVTHESKVWPKGDGKTQTDPADIRVPAYHPDNATTRRDWAQYYDNMHRMDTNIAKRLKELDDAGLTEDTIIFYYGDHGAGMPRGKRWLYDSGTLVPLIVVVPEKWKDWQPVAAGEICKEKVAFIDFAPTVLSLAGITVPDVMQGRAFLGPQKKAEPDYIHLFRDRMDERVDFCRAVTDGNYRYIFNFYPERPQAQHIEYMYRNPTLKAWKALADAGKLPAHQTAFFRAKPVVELYDLNADPDEVKNLAGDSAQEDRLAKMHAAMVAHMVCIRDLGVFPEPLLHSRAGERTPYEAGQATSEADYRRILQVAEAAARGVDRKTVAGWLGDTEPAVRYWGVLAVGRHFADEKAMLIQVAGHLDDPDVSTAIAAAERVVASGVGDQAAALAVLAKGLDNPEATIALRAANSIDRLGRKALPLKELVEKVAGETGRGYPNRVCQHAVLNLR